MRIEPVFLFDLDGTLVDSVYQHVLAWKEALDAEGIELSVWRIPYGQKIETAQRRQRSNIFGLGPVLHNKLAVDA
jgi:beta-phosphoglucomutase-like phosphatase (HAD superfamily)